jgi:hypothetical protein
VILNKFLVVLSVLLFLAVSGCSGGGGGGSDNPLDEPGASACAARATNGETDEVKFSLDPS